MITFEIVTKIICSTCKEKAISHTVRHEEGRGDEPLGTAFQATKEVALEQGWRFPADASHRCPECAIKLADRMRELDQGTIDFDRPAADPIRGMIGVEPKDDPRK